MSDSVVLSPKERRAAMNEDNVCYAKYSPAAALSWITLAFFAAPLFPNPGLNLKNGSGRKFPKIIENQLENKY
jgi:hypothetical protein